MSLKFLARLSVLLPLLALTACAPKMIPNTRIADTEDHRAVLAVVQRYKRAYEAKDAEAIAALASPKYLDARDNISHATLEKELQEDFDRVKEVQLELNVRDIRIDGDRAQVDYFYTTSFLLATSHPEWQREVDEKRMVLERTNGDWLVVSGL